MQISETVSPMGGSEPCRFPKLEECAHFHYERVQLPQICITLQTNMDHSLHSQHTTEDETSDWYTIQVSSLDERWLIQRTYENFTMLDQQLHQCIYDRKVSQLPELSMEMTSHDNLEDILSSYLSRFCAIVDNSLNCGPVLNWLQLDNRGHRLLVPSEESRSINTPAVAAAYSIRKYVSQARDELSLEVGDMISVIDMTSPGESIWWRGKRGFQVGFFPQYCVHIIGDKVPRNMPLPPPVVGSLAISPIKPVLRKHGKLITFFRSFILNRPSRRRLKQSGILKERVFGCDLGEHLLNSGHDIPMVLKCCAEFIESHGIVDGIYRLSGVTSNIQKLRNAFDEDRIPNLYTDDILQDIHSVASLLKMYFRELPNPLCTYQLYHSFVAAVQGCTSARSKANDNERLLKMREAVQKLPPPHYRTLEYLMRHLARVAEHGANTGMTTRNVAIVWAPNLLRCEELEIGGVAALQGVGVQAVVTEFLVCYADLIFSDHLPNLSDAPTDVSELNSVSPKRSRPKSLAISTPTKLITLEEARNKHFLNKNDDYSYIEVGGGPKNLPEKYHTVIELPAGSRKRGLAKRSPSGWRSFFSKSRNNSQGNLTTKNREISSPGIAASDKSVTESDLSEMKRKLRPVKSAESLTSGQSEPTLCDNDVLGPLHCLNKPSGHNRSVSHDSYFDNLQSSTNNSVGSLLDLSEIQLNFELEESEMRIFSEDESLVSSPKVVKETAARKVLSRARPEDFGSAANSSNPSPKKQARVVLSPDSLSRKRSRLEDQLSDIQYIDCNTPDNPCTISTTALIHNQEPLESPDAYQPKNKSPRNSNVSNRHSLNFDVPDKIISIPKSLTEMDIEKLNMTSENSGFLTPTPQSPNYKRLESVSSSCSTPLASLETSPVEIRYEKFSDERKKAPAYEREVKSMSEYKSNPIYDTPKNRPTSLDSGRHIYENVPKDETSPTYENVCTINIIYKSPIKVRNAQDNIYEDIELNSEKVIIPTTVASLPVQEATQPETIESYENRSEQTRLSLETTFDTYVTTVQRPSKSSESSSPKTPREPLISQSEAPTVSGMSPTKSEFSPSSSLASPKNEREVFDISLADERTHNATESDVSTPSESPISEERDSRNGVLDADDVPNEVVDAKIPLESNINSTSHENIKIGSPNSTISVLRPNSNKFANMKNLKDKRKSCDAEIIDGEHSIYQQVKYFRRSVHEINSLLDLYELKSNLTKSKSESANLNDSKNPKSLVANGVVDKQDCITLPKSSELPEVIKPPVNFEMDKPIGDHNFHRLPPKKTTEPETLDSLEEDNVHLYENVADRKVDDPRFRMHESAPKTLNISSDVVQSLPLCSKCSPEKNVKDLKNIFETKDRKENLDYDLSRNATLPKCKIISYDKNSLPPCLRAKQAKNSVKTRSLDENAFITEFGGDPNAPHRRKSLDERTSSFISPKILNELKDNNNIKTELISDQKLNRERIEKYKEERRNYLREKYRSESFREDKEKLLSRFKQKSFKAKEDADGKSPLEQILDRSRTVTTTNPSDIPRRTRTKSQSDSEKSFSSDSLTKPPPPRSTLDDPFAKPKSSSLGKPPGPSKVRTECKKLSQHALAKFEKEPKRSSPVLERKSSRSSLKEISDKIFDENDSLMRVAHKEDEFLRHRRADADSEKRRHTYDLYRERDSYSENQRRVSLETKNTRREKCSPSYCIKDMKALFESKSQQ